MNVAVADTVTLPVSVPGEMNAGDVDVVDVPPDEVMSPVEMVADAVASTVVEGSVLSWTMCTPSTLLPACKMTSWRELIS